MAKKSSPKGGDHMPLVSFKINRELFEQLEKLAKDQIDDAGNQLTASTMARKIVRDQLLNRQKGK